MRNPDPRNEYIDSTFGLNDSELVAVRAALTKADREFMAISSAEARILQFLIRTSGIRTIVEIGTLYGYSTLAMAQALPSDGSIITLEKDDNHFQIANTFFAKSRAAKLIDSRQGDAVELLREVNTPVDLVFIDANKSAYLNYLDWAEQNVRPGGYIVGDNTFLFGAVWGDSQSANVSKKQTEVMREFNRRLSDPTRYHSVMIPTTEGMTVAQRITS